MIGYDLFKFYKSFNIPSMLVYEWSLMYNISHYQVFVHGEQNERMRLKAALIREYEENEETLNIHSPANSETIELHFRGEKMAKVSMFVFT